jgi:hypothetical protein
MDATLSFARRAAGARSRLGRWTAPLLALLLTLPALWPLARPGFFVSDDGRFHIYRVAALAEAWQAGALHPRLFPQFGFGYGQAVLNFYAPLSYWPGAALALLGLNPATAVKLTIALGFLLAALAAYGYARYLWGPAGGVLAAVAYTCFPYHLADAYLRGAVPEHFAFIWLPLILWAYTAAFREERPAAPLLWGALAWAGLVYTHNLTALLMAMALVVYLPILAAWTGRWRRLLPAAGSLALAIALSAPLWLPFLAESRAVGIGLGPSDGYQKHLAPLGQAILGSPLYRYRLTQGGAADHPLSWLTLALIVLVIGLLAWRRARRQRILAAPALGFSLLLALASIFMITATSLPIWLPLAPVLAQLQYPWRFLTLTAVGMIGVAGALPSLLMGSSNPSAAITVSTPTTTSDPTDVNRALYPVAKGLCALIVLLLMAVSLPYLPAAPLPFTPADAWSPARMWKEDAEAGQVGATWTGEFLPQTVREQRWALGRPLEGAIDGPAPAALPAVTVERVGYQRLDVRINAPVAGSVRLHQFYLAGWNATLDGATTRVYPTSELGLATADVPAGDHLLAWRFGPAPARTAAAILGTLAALLSAVLLWRIAVRYRRPARRAAQTGAVALVILTLALDLNSLGVGQRTSTPRPVQATFGDVAQLVGYDAAPARGENALDVTLYWYALRDVSVDYKVFVHLLDGAGQVAAQDDRDPGGGYSPTTRWRAGEIIADTHRLALPVGMPTGDYTLKAGVYQYQPLRNLPITPPTADGRAGLGSVHLPQR